MKSYTDLEQSKKLAEILSPESSDMLFYCSKESNTLISESPFTRSFKETNTFSYVPCWSLAALFDILPDRTCVYKKTYKDGRVKYKGIMEGNKELILKDNPIDTCVEMILKFNELKKL